MHSYVVHKEVSNDPVEHKLPIDKQMTTWWARHISWDDDLVQAGARKVYAVEASNMAEYARTLAAANPGTPAV